MCKQIGISGDKIKNELVEKLKELPDMYDKVNFSTLQIHISFIIQILYSIVNMHLFQVCNKIIGLNPAIDLYVSFTKCIINEQQSQFCLPLIKYIAENGNTTVYEWSFGEPPLSIEPDPIQIELDVEVNKDNQVIMCIHMYNVYVYICTYILKIYFVLDRLWWWCYWFWWNSIKQWRCYWFWRHRSSKWRDRLGRYWIREHWEGRNFIVFCS